MAKTYYKYKERGQQVDYAEISRNFSQGIMDTVTGIKKEADEFSDEVKAAQEAVKKDTEERVKEKRTSKGKSATEKGDYGIEVGAYELPMTIERDVNSVFVDLSTQAADRGLEFKRNRDSQKISDSDYKLKKNALDNTFNVLKQSAVGINKLAEETAAGMKDGTADPTQQLAFQELMSYNFTDPRVKIKIGDDGIGFMYRVNDEGEELPKTRRTVSQLRNMAMQRYPSYDFDGNANAIVTKLGKTLETLGRRGMTTEELLKREPIGNSVNGGEITPMNIIDDYAEGLDEDDLASILMGQLGSKFKPTFNPEVAFSTDADGNVTYDQSKILFVPQNLASGVNKNTAQLTDEQRERAIEFVKMDILSQFNVKPAAAYKPSATERKAAEERTASIRTARTNVTNLRKIFEGKSPAEVNQALSTYNRQLKKVATDADGEFIRAQVSGEGNERKIEVVYRNKFGDIISEKVADIPENFQDFVDAAGTTITGDRNILTLREEAMAEIDDPSALTRGDEGGKYEVTVVEEQLPSIDTDVTLSDAMDAVVSELDSFSYFNMGNAYSDMSTAAEDMFEKMEFEDYNITRNGDILTISIPEYGSLDFNMNKSAHGDDHDNRRGAFKKHMQSIYTALTTGKKMGGKDVDYSSK